MKATSAQKKGKRLENYTIQQIEEMGLGSGVRTPGSGSGKKKGDVFWPGDFMIECKNEAQTNFLTNVDQAKRQAEIGNHYKDKWALITRDPRYPEFQRVYVTIDLHEWLELLKKNREPITKEPDKEAKWKIQRLVQDAKEVIKIYEE